MSSVTNLHHHDETKMGNQELPALDHESICEGFGCLAKATQEIKLPVGTLGKITLNVCGKCQSKFNVKNVPTHITPIKKSQYSKSLVSRRDRSIAHISTTPEEPHLNDN